MERPIDNWQNQVRVLLAEAPVVHQVLIVPQEQRALRDLKVLTSEPLRERLEERLVDLLQLVASHQLQNLFQLVQEDHLLRRARPWPVAQDTLDDRYGRLGVFLDVLRDAIRELLVVHRHALGLVQWHERAHEELQVFRLQWHRESVDDTSQNLEQLANSVVTLRLVHEAVEHVADRLSDERSVRHKLAVDAMQDGF